MYPVSPEFVKEVKRSHTVVCEAELVRSGVVLLDHIPIISGTVTDDPSALIRRRCQVTLGAAEDLLRLVPGRTSGEDFGLWPTGSELRIRQGLKYRNKSLGIEWVPFGSFQISKPTIKDTPDGLEVTVDGYDRSRKIGRSLFTEPFEIAHGSNAVDAIMRTILKNCGNWLSEDDFDFEEMRTFSQWSGTGLRLITPHLVFDRGDNPWQKATDLATANGLDLYVSREDKITLRVAPNLLFDDPVFEYSEGDDCILTSIERELDDEEAYNGVIAIGENSSNDTTVRYEIWDEDPNSPLYRRGEYGSHPYILNSQEIATTEQAAAAAAAKYVSLTGIMENIRFSAFSNFAQEAHDVIHIKRDRSNVHGDYILAQVTIGLGADGRMDGSTRSRGLS